MNKELAANYVLQHGDGLQRARLSTLLHGRADDDRSALSFLNLQNADGSFPAMRISGQRGTVNSTVDALWWLEELGRLDSSAARSACAWLIDRQEGNGSWDEVVLPGISFPSWIEPGDSGTIAYLTAYSAYWLARCGLRNHTAFQRSLGFLQRQQQENGCIAGPLHATWLAAAVFLLAGAHYADIAGRCLACLLARPLKQWGDSQLAWALNCLGCAGLPDSHPFVSGSLGELTRRQAADGSWRSEDGPQFNVEATLGALRAFELNPKGAKTA
jgi:squalene cyclase